MSTSKYIYEKISHAKTRRIEQADIAFDLDGIVLDTATEMWAAFMKHLKLDWPISRWTDYDAESILGIPTKQLRPLYEPILARHDLPEVPGAGQALNNLFHKYDEPLLFVTARRKQFKEAAIDSLRNIIDLDVEFEIVFMDEVCEDEYRKNKVDILKQYGVKLFVEDNWMHWEEYIDSGIQIVTLDWPWTIGRVIDLKQKGKTVICHPNWKYLYSHLDTFMENNNGNHRR